MTHKRDNKDILKRLNAVRQTDFQKSLFYCWDKIPKDIQDDFISWCLRYTQASFEDCIGGWEAGWHKEHEKYILWLKGKWSNPITEREEARQ